MDKCSPSSPASSDFLNFLIGLRTTGSSSMCPRLPSVSGMKIAKTRIGMNEIINDPRRLATWPNSWTTSCPRKLLMVAPKPKHDAVSPISTLNRPVPKVISATMYGCSSPKKPPPTPSNIWVETRYPSPASFHRTISAHRMGRESRAIMKSGFRPHPRSVILSPASVARDMVNCAITMAPAVRGMAERLVEPSSLSPPINSPSTSRTFALAKLFVVVREKQ
mmetsp:Transcript_28011/g.82363  ORF Transcript_28011/g.82363 Transcript_28011/m.82363 type:complete len:221 (-) Transcript_28011:1329-1991(-)